MKKRRSYFKEISDLVINTDDGNIKKHVELIINQFNLDQAESDLPLIKDSDCIKYHKTNKQVIRLTKQQAMITKLLSIGYSAKEIAKKLDISYRTVEGHLVKIKNLLGCNSSSELISVCLTST